MAPPITARHVAILLTLTLWLAEGTFGFGYNNMFSNSWNNWGQGKRLTLRQLTERILELEAVLSSTTDRLAVAETVINDLARQSCSTGVVMIQTCPDFGEVPLDNIIACVSQPVSGSGAVSSKFKIFFPTPFLMAPVLDVSLSGQALVFGKNCTVDINAVASDHFNFTYTADDLLPVAVELTWFACPSPLFMGNEGLPLPDLTHGPQPQPEDPQPEDPQPEDPQPEDPQPELNHGNGPWWGFPNMLGGLSRDDDK